MSGKKYYRIIIEDFNDRVRASKQLRSLISIPPEKAFRVLEALPLILIETDNFEKYKDWQEKTHQSGSYLVFKEITLDEKVEDELSRSTKNFVGRGKTSLEEEHRIVSYPGNKGASGIKSLSKQRDALDNIAEAVVVSKRKNKFLLRSVLLIGGVILFFGFSALVQDETLSTFFVIVGIICLLILGLSIVPLISKVIYRIDEVDRELWRKRNIYWECSACKGTLPNTIQPGDHCPTCGAEIRFR